MDEDDSLMAGLCHEWGVDGWDAEPQNIVYKIGKWGPPFHDQRKLSDHSAFVVALSHWVLDQDGVRLDCDDYDDGVSSGDFWKVFVR